MLQQIKMHRNRDRMNYSPLSRSASAIDRLLERIDPLSSGLDRILADVSSDIGSELTDIARQ